MLPTYAENKSNLFLVFSTCDPANDHLGSLDYVLCSILLLINIIINLVKYVAGHLLIRARRDGVNQYIADPLFVEFSHYVFYFNLSMFCLR